jgi:Fe(3+) dicitrate transport protein
MQNRVGVLAAGAALIASMGVANAEPETDADTVDASIVVRGVLPEALSNVPGSVFRIDRETLQTLAPITAKEALRRAPGVTVVDEDAFGFKLNLSVRGLSPRRSLRTLLLEDGAPIQPAPYADPSAHYYPPPERMERIDVRKGSGQIMFGPQTIGGVVDFVTGPATDEPGWRLRLGAGDRNYRSVHAAVSQFGVAGAVTGKAGDGTRDGHETMLVEGVIRGSWRLAPAHTLALKAQYAQEDTTLSEGGLTEARYAFNPYANPFENDRFALERKAFQAVHGWRMRQGVSLSTQIYAADTFRASYRQADASTDAMTANPATGCIGAARTDYENFAALCGNKMRPRRFRFAGVEPRLRARHSILGLAAETTAGVRLHTEDTRRRRYNGLTPDAREDTPGTLLRDDNRITTSALAVFGQSTVSAGAWKVTPGIRVEQIDTRNEALTFNFVSLNRARETDKTITLPGLGLTYAPSPEWTYFAGFHQGFAPPRPDRDVDPNAPFSDVRPERSTDLEVGLRATPHQHVGLEATLFDLELVDLIVGGAQIGRAPGTFVNAGKARHAGVELSGRWAPPRGASASFAYTNLFTASFLSDADETARNVRGNRIPYAPEHHLDAAIGYASGPFRFEIGVDWLSEQFADAANTLAPSADGQRGLIPDRTLWRMAAHLEPPDRGWRLFASVQNLFDEPYISARTDGLFAGARRQAMIGVELVGTKRH